MISIVAHITQGISLGDLHPILVHFPIVLFIVGFVLDLLYAFGKTSAYPMGHWFIIIAALMAIPTVFTGLEAEEMHEESPYVRTHMILAITTLCYGCVHALIRLIALLEWKKFPSWIFISLSFINVLLVGITAEYGGAVTRGKLLMTALWSK